MEIYQFNVGEREQSVAGNRLSYKLHKWLS